jgi:hypothetical protein
MHISESKKQEQHYHQTAINLPASLPLRLIEEDAGGDGGSLGLVASDSFHGIDQFVEFGHRALLLPYDTLTNLIGR